MVSRAAVQANNQIAEVLAHLLHYGGLSPAEVSALKADEAVNFLENDGWLARQSEAWVVTEQLLGLLPVSNLTDLTCQIFFSHSIYRHYLTTVAAAEIARRGLEGAMSQVEGWLIQDLPHLAGEINRLLDGLECDYLDCPIKACSPGDLLKGFKAIIAEIEKEADTDFESWNKALLGVSGDQEAVFQAVIARQALAHVRQAPGLPLTVPDKKIADLNEELATPLGRPVLFPSLETDAWEDKENRVPKGGPAWTRREYIYSSLPLFLCESEAKAASQPNRGGIAVQDAFTQHPVTWTLIQLGIYQYVHQAAGGGLPCLKLRGVTDESRTLMDIRLELDERPVGNFLELLPDLLATLGWRLVLPFGKVSAEGLDRLMTAMTQASIFEETKKGGCVLAEPFTRTLFERPRYQQLNKGVKLYRERLIQKLEEVLSSQAKEEAS
jgi:hypothetical protein